MEATSRKETASGDRMLLGDCLELMGTLEPASVDLVVMDPPYFLPATHYQPPRGKKLRRSLSDLSMLEHFYQDVFDGLLRVLKPTGALYSFCDGQSYPVFYAVTFPLFRRVVPLVWDKGTSLNGYSWRHQHELILFAEMQDYPAVKTGDGDILKCRAVPVADRIHPAEKPVELLTRLVEKSCPSRGLVLDPFAGSASTGIAALKSGRHFIGMESDATYRAVALERLRAFRSSLATPQDSVTDEKRH